MSKVDLRIERLSKQLLKALEFSWKSWLQWAVCILASTTCTKCISLQSTLSFNLNKYIIYHIQYQKLLSSCDKASLPTRTTHVHLSLQNDISKLRDICSIDKINVEPTLPRGGRCRMRYFALALRIDSVTFILRLGNWGLAQPCTRPPWRRRRASVTEAYEFAKSKGRGP